MDNEILNYRKQLYNRQNVFITNIIKHYDKNCNCVTNKKICICSGFIDLNKLNNIKYIEENFDKFETLYNICQSITQAMRSNSGKNFEKAIEKVLNNYGFIKNIHYKSQIYITDNNLISYKKVKNSHSIDFMIPVPKDGMHLNNYNGELISCKTTLRERYLQDRFIGKFTLISLEKINCKNVKSIQIKKDGNEFKKWFLKIKLKYFK
jgi:hypothetical protein